MKRLHGSFITLSVLTLLSWNNLSLSAAPSSTSCPKDTTVYKNGTHCTDLKSDEANCGSCGNVCTIGTFCFNGTCKCLEGETLCGGRCVDTSFDPNNCGKCGSYGLGEQFL